MLRGIMGWDPGLAAKAFTVLMGVLSLLVMRDFGTTCRGVMLLGLLTLSTFSHSLSQGVNRRDGLLP